jgi:hypothetical protein
MAVRVSKVDVWTGTMPDHPGALDAILAPLADAGANLECVMARRQPHQPGQGHVYLTPIKGRKAQQAAAAAGLHRADNISTLRVEMPNQPGAGHAVMQSISDASINVHGVSAVGLGRVTVVYMGFDSPADAARAAVAIKAAGKSRRRTR